MTRENTPKLLLLGWAGADWRLIQPLLDAGQLPHLEQLIANGVMGNLLTLTPPEPPALWTSLATGRHADAHGILSQIVPDGGRLGIRPVNSTDLNAPPLWQILSDAGKRAAAVGWPVTHPANVFDALVVSDAFAEATGKDVGAWPLGAGDVSAAELHAPLADLRLHPAAVTAEQLRPFFTKTTRTAQQDDQRLALLATNLARTISIQDAASWIAEHCEWDFLAVHFDLIERLSEAFIQYQAPRIPHVTERDFEIYAAVVDGAYRLMDMLLGRHLELVDPTTRVMIVSEHGVVTDQFRPPLAKKPAGDEVAQKHREFGILVSSGVGIKRDNMVFGANLLDIAPTALALLGVPLSRELEGRVLTQIFTKVVAPTFRSTYPVPDFRTRGKAWQDEDWTMGRIAELAARKPLPRRTDHADEAARQAKRQRLSNLTAVLITKRQPAAALDTLKELIRLTPEFTKTGLAIEQADALGICKALDETLEPGRHRPMGAHLFGQTSVKEEVNGSARQSPYHAKNGPIGIRQLLARIGEAHLQAKRWHKAEQAFREALDFNPNFAQALTGLGVALAEQERHEEAIEHLLSSIALHYQQAAAHLHLGVSLAALGRHQQAAEALRRALRIQPDLPQAEAMLKKLKTGLQNG